jgi:F0F1-type ATP synthase membrane subunit b/b'
MDAMFTERLDEAAAAALERATRQLATELRGTLAELARDLVTRAVAEEITRAQLDAADRDAAPF